MTLLLKWKGWRFVFYSANGHEPPHVHVYKNGKETKIWLQPLKIAYNVRCQPHEIASLLKLVEAHKDEFLEKWYEYFDN